MIHHLVSERRLSRAAIVSASNTPSRYLVVGLALAWMAAPRAETTFTPRVLVSATWTDNIELVADDAGPQTEYVLQLNPGFRLEQDSLRMDSFVDYTMQNLFFMEVSDRNTTYHQFEGNTRIEALREWFFLEAAATYTQVAIDPEQPISNGNLFDTGNISDAVTGRVTPRIEHVFGAARVDASYTRAVVEYDEQGGSAGAAEDSENEETAFLIGSADENDVLTWALHYDSRTTEYDVSPTFKYEQAGADLGWEVGAALRLLGRGGSESDPARSISEGGLDSTYWKVGFRWRPGSLHEFEVLGGERFFGRSLEGHWKRTSRMLRLELRYTEEPTTEAENFALRPAVADSPLDQLPTTDDFSRLTADVYVSKRLLGHVGLVGRLTEVALEVTSEDREYVSLGVEEEVDGLTFSVLRQLGPRFSLRLDAGARRAELRTGNDADDWNAAVTLARKVSPTANLNLVLRHIEREGDVGNYDSNAATLRFDKEF